MTDVSTIIGVTLLGVGAASAIYGTILCWRVKVSNILTKKSTYPVFLFPA